MDCIGSATKKKQQNKTKQNNQRNQNAIKSTTERAKERKNK